MLPHVAHRMAWLPESARPICRPPDDRFRSGVGEHDPPGYVPVSGTYRNTADAAEGAALQQQQLVCSSVLPVEAVILTAGGNPVCRLTARKHLHGEVDPIPDFYAGRRRPRGESRVCESLAYL